MAARKIWSGLAYVAYLCAALLAVDLIAHSIYVSGLRGRNAPGPEIIERPIQGVALQVGALINSKPNFFRHVPLEKPPGVVRIGCFGDSFTAGSEVGDGRDFPALLQQLFGQAGLAHVEVINFGLGWTGFSQAYMAWEQLGPQFDLDIVVLGPLGFFAHRDLRFNHTDGMSPYYLHSRFILDGEDVTRIDVVGETGKDRFDAYYGFMPKTRYLRYDREPPSFLAALLPRGRTLANPFYYTKLSSVEEGREIWRRLLGRMAAAGSAVVMGNYDPDIVQTARLVNRTNLVTAELRTRWQFPYKAPKGHDSPMGNLHVARQYFALLTGDSSAIPYLAMEDLAELSVPATAAGALDTYDRVEFAIDGESIGSFGSPDDTSPTFLKRHRIKTLVVIREREQDLLSAFFVGLPFELTDELARDSAFPMRRLHANLALWSIDLDRAIEHRTRPRGLRVGSESVPKLEAIDLGGGPWFEAHPEAAGLSDLEAKTPKGWLGVAADPQVLLDESALAKRGGVDMVLTRGDTVVRFPIASWQRASMPPPDAAGAQLVPVRP